MKTNPNLNTLMSKKTKLYQTLCLMMLAACTSKLTPTQEVDYNEDLSIHRPTNEVALVELDTEDPENSDPIPVFDVIEADTNIVAQEVKIRLDSLVDSIAINSRARGYIEGFAIQVYTGNNREKANEAKAKVYELLPDSYPRLRYQQPIFKVKVGRFYTRLEAQEMYSVLKEEINTAIIVPERIYPKR